MNQPNPAQLNALLNIASKKLGVAPETLAASAANGGYDGLLKSLSPEKRRALEGMLGDPAQLQALLQSEQVRRLLAQFTK